MVALFYFFPISQGLHNQRVLQYINVYLPVGTSVELLYFEIMSGSYLLAVSHLITSLLF